VFLTVNLDFRRRGDRRGSRGANNHEEYHSRRRRDDDDSHTMDEKPLDNKYVE